MAEQAKLKPDPVGEEVLAAAHHDPAGGARPALGPVPVGDYYQGGTFCSMEFDGDKSRIIEWK